MGTLVCRLELSKEKGILLTVENPADQITQTIILDGTSITTTVAGSRETSTITQDQDSIKMVCKEFTLDAETITCTSSQKTLLKSDDDFQVKSGQVGVTADNDATHKALNTTIESNVGTTVSGKTLALEGTGSADLKGGTIKLDSKGLLDLVSKGIATLEGSVSNVKGVVKLG